MKRLPLVYLFIAVLVVCYPLGAQVTFEGLDLDPSGTLLFSARTDSPVFGEYRALFSSDLAEKSLSQLTYFPEKVSLLGNGGRLQIQNRFGLFRTGEGFKDISPLTEVPAFSGGGEISVGKTATMAASPDGRYLVYQKPVSPGYANLFLRDLGGGKEILLVEKVALKYSQDQISWSGDSRYFVYTKGENIYYFSINQYLSDQILPEEYRSLGEGSLKSVFWTSQGDLFLVSGKLVFKILGAELFTSTLYRNLLERGTLVGKIPFEFDANFDAFWVSADEKKLLLNKGDQNFFVYYLQDRDYLSTGGSVVSLPYLYLPRNTRVRTVIWSSDDLVTLMTEGLANGERVSHIYRLDLGSTETALSFTVLDDRGVKGLALSPDGTKVAVRLSDRVVVRDYRTWRVDKTRRHPEPLHILWADAQQLVLAGRYFTEIWNSATDTGKILFLSQAESYGYTKEGRNVAARTQGASYRHEGGGLWSLLPSGETPELGEPTVSSPRYRVYLAPSSDRTYNNQVMVRLVEKLGTVPLFPLPDKRFAPFPAEDDPLDEYYFSHGSRVRRREVSLVFNAVDSADGLTEVLSVLDEYNLKATFFLNGDFIRRNPDAAREIALSGHEVGSLFYTYFNMTDSRYVVDKEFIKKGLARNEDDYFASTGRELTLLWHAPFYVVNSDILAASREMNYDYIGRDVDPLDWTLSDPAAGLTGGLSVPEMVERVIRLKKPGSIIPIRLGINDQRSGGYLYNNLDVLLNALLEEGYTVVPVSVLMEHAR